MEGRGVSKPREGDLAVVHYRPASRLPWCGAHDRMRKLNDYRVLDNTSDLNQVTCELCRAEIGWLVDRWRKKD
jgi:hypothetical protein